MAQKTPSKPLTFGELKFGQLFIMFPTDGDDKENGGFRKPYHSFSKFRGQGTYNSVRTSNGIECHFPDDALVILID